MTTVMALTAEPLDLGEGVRVVDGRLVLVDILEGTLYSHPGDEFAPLETVASFDVPLGAVAPVAGRPGVWIAAMGDGVALLAPGREPQWLGRPEARHEGRTRMNDGVCDPSGRFWAGSMAYDGKTPDGALYRVDPDGGVEQVLDDLVISNGPAFTPDGATMFHADTARGTITRFDVDAEGRLSGAKVLVRDESADPDGMTTDQTGALWVAMWGGSQLRRYSPDGELLATVPLPVTNPTSVALVPGHAIVTTARHGLEDPDPLDGLVLRVALDGFVGDVSGGPAHAFGQATRLTS